MAGRDNRKTRRKQRQATRENEKRKTFDPETRMTDEDKRVLNRATRGGRRRQMHQQTRNKEKHPSLPEYE